MPPKVPPSKVVAAWAPACWGVVKGSRMLSELEATPPEPGPLTRSTGVMRLPMLCAQDIVGVGALLKCPRGTGVSMPACPCHACVATAGGTSMVGDWVRVEEKADGGKGWLVAAAATWGLSSVVLLGPCVARACGVCIPAAAAAVASLHKPVVTDVIGGPVWSAVADLRPGEVVEGVVSGLFAMAGGAAVTQLSA